MKPEDIKLENTDKALITMRAFEIVTTVKSERKTALLLIKIEDQLTELYKYAYTFGHIDGQTVEKLKRLEEMTKNMKG